MKRSQAFSHSRTSHSLRSDVDSPSSRSRERGAGGSRSLGARYCRSLPRQVAAARDHAYNAAATSPYYVRSASVTASPTADSSSPGVPSTDDASIHRSFDRSHSQSVHSIRHPHDDLVYRDLGSSESGVSISSAAYHDSAPVYRSVAFRSVATEPALQEPVAYANGHGGTKHSAWLSRDKYDDHFSTPYGGGHHYNSFPGRLNNTGGGVNPKDLLEDPLGPPSLGGQSHPTAGADFSMMPPSLGATGATSEPGRLDFNQPSLANSGVDFPKAVSVTDFTTLSTLKQLCKSASVTPSAKPEWVEPHTNFELLAVPRDIALSIGSFLAERKIVFAYVAKECLFQCESYTQGCEVSFNVALYNANDDRSPSPDDEGRLHCVAEFQRRRGDCVQFGTLYRSARDHLTTSFTATTPDDEALSQPEAQEEERVVCDVADKEEEGEADSDAADIAAMCDISCAALLADNIPAGSPLAPNEVTVPEADSTLLTTLSEMINSALFEEQYEATTTVARLAANEFNARRILGHEASVNGLIATLRGKRDPRVQRSAATSVANLVSHPEHVPRGSLNLLVVSLIALLLLSTSLEVVRESARALVSLADLHQHFEPSISESVSCVLAKLDATRDEVAIGYRNELVRKVPAMSF